MLLCCSLKCVVLCELPSSSVIPLHQLLSIYPAHLHNLYVLEAAYLIICHIISFTTLLTTLRGFPPRRGWGSGGIEPAHFIPIARLKSHPIAGPRHPSCGIPNRKMYVFQQALSIKYKKTNNKHNQNSLRSQGSFHQLLL